MSSNSIFNKDYFELFGLKRQFKQDAVEIRKQYLMLQSNFHPDKVANHSSYEKQYFLQLSTLINDAYQTLTSPLKRAQYLLASHLQSTQAQDGLDKETLASNTTFLMEQMSLREEVEELKLVSKPDVLAALKNKIFEALIQHEQALENYFEQLISEKIDKTQKTNVIRQEIERLIFELQFYLKLDEELKNI